MSEKREGWPPPDTAEVFEDMIGKVCKVVVVQSSEDDSMTFTSDDGHVFRFYHSQDCCESVGIYEIHGEVADLEGSPLVQAEAVAHANVNAPDGGHESWTWTFYKFATAKGAVTVRWLGSSNGYYGEGVSFRHTKPEEEVQP